METKIVEIKVNNISASNTTNYALIRKILLLLKESQTFMVTETVPSCTSNNHKFPAMDKSTYPTESTFSPLQQETMPYSEQTPPAHHHFNGHFNM